MRAYVSETERERADEPRQPASQPAYFKCFVRPPPPPTPHAHPPPRPTPQPHLTHTHTETLPSNSLHLLSAPDDALDLAGPHE